MPTQSRNEQTHYYTIALIAIVVFGAWIRLVQLDYMAFHHDESIHALHAYNLYESKPNWTYKYDPTYHGPFLYHFGALYFLLFGDNDYTARLPFVTFGILMFYFIWRLKPWIGKEGVFCCMLLAATSPTLTYFSRFARNDIYMATMAMGILVFALEYIRGQKNRHLVFMTFFLALMYCCKENSYMTGFFMGSFIVLYGIYYYFSHPHDQRNLAASELFVKRSPFVKIVVMYGLFSCAAFTFVWYVSHSEAYKELARQFKLQMSAESFNINVLNNAWDAWMQQHTVFASLGVLLWWIVPICVALGLFFLFWVIGKKSTPEPDNPVQTESFFLQVAKTNLPVVFSVLVAVSVYTFLFSTMGQNPDGMRDGIVDYVLYWMGQQGAPRIPGPPDYYIPRLIVYELALLVFAFLSIFVYSFFTFSLVRFAAFHVTVWSTVWMFWKIVLQRSPSIMLVVLIWLVFLCAAIALVAAEKFLASIFERFKLNVAGKPDPKHPLYLTGIRAFFIYWAIFSILIYGLLEEKVPWLMVHQVQPLMLLAGVFIADLWRAMNPGWLRNGFVALTALLIIYDTRANIQLIVFRPDDPRELMVYTQSSHEVVDIVNEMKRVAKLLGHEYMPNAAGPDLDYFKTRNTRIDKKPIAMIHRDANWPYVWYLRHYRVAIEEIPTTNDVPFVIVPPELEQKMKIWANGKYSMRRVRHRVWWPSPPAVPEQERVKIPAVRHEFPINYGVQRNMQPSEIWSMFWNYIIYRQIWDPNDPNSYPGSTDMLLYTRTPMIEPIDAIQVTPGYDQPTRLLSVIGMVGSLGINAGEFKDPRGVAVSPDQSRLYVLDTGNGRIQAFDLDLNYLATCGAPGDGLGQFSLNYGGPNGGIDVGNDGTIYVTDTWAAPMTFLGRINRFTSTGQPLPPITPPANNRFYFPRGLAVADDGTLYVADTGNHRIVKFNPDGAFAGELVKSVIQEPVGITVGPNGLIYVCSVNLREVVAFNSFGHQVRSWSVVGWTPVGGNTSSIEPYVAVDNAGFVYVTDSTSHTIHRFDPEGRSVALAGGRGSGRGQLTGPKGITIDAQGNLYIADSGNHRIVKARFSN